MAVKTVRRLFKDNAPTGCAPSAMVRLYIFLGTKPCTFVCCVVEASLFLCFPLISGNEYSNRQNPTRLYKPPSLHPVVKIQIKTQRFLFREVLLVSPTLHLERMERIKHVPKLLVRCYSTKAKATYDGGLLQDKDRIFQNLYNDHGSDIRSAEKLVRCLLIFCDFGFAV